MSGLFSNANLLEVGGKKNTLFLNFVYFKSPPNQNDVKYFHNKCKDKGVLIETTLKLAKSRKAKLPAENADI